MQSRKYLLIILIPILLSAQSGKESHRDTPVGQPMIQNPISDNNEHQTAQKSNGKNSGNDNSLSLHSDYAILTRKDFRRAKAYRAGGISLICISATAFVPGVLANLSGLFMEEPFFYAIGFGCISSGVTGIIFGKKLIRKGNSIDGPSMTVAPVVNPIDNNYGAVLTINF